MSRCENLKLACYHAIAVETGARPGELLQLKISDINLKVSPATGNQHCEIWIGREGKTRKGRPATLYTSIPYFNVWLQVHHSRDRPQNAYLFPSQEKRNLCKNVPLKEGSLRSLYVRTVKQEFPTLLLRQDIDDKEKVIIKSLISKPCHPYLQRHNFATEIAHKVSQQSFNQLLGQSKGSRMYEIYVQDLGFEGNRELQISRGIIERDETISIAEKKMIPKQCWKCFTSNKNSAKFCISCNAVISQEGYLEMKEEEKRMQVDQEQTKNELEQVKSRVNTFNENIAYLKSYISKRNNETLYLVANLVKRINPPSEQQEPTASQE